MTDPPNTAASPKPIKSKPDVRPTTLLKTIVAHMVLTAAVLSLFSLAASLAFVIPSFREVFDDFDTEIPALTIAVIYASGHATAIGVIALAVGLIVLAITCRRRPGLVALLSLLVLLAALLAMAISTIALFLPLARSMQSLA